MKESKTKYVKSPLNYVGGKTRLLPQILPLFPKTKRFIDLFCGGANVCVNVDADIIIANDNNLSVVEIYRAFKELGSDEVVKYVRNKCEAYNLNKINAEGFNKFRKEYNESPDKNPLDLFILICHCFNHQIRFNKNGEFNMPFGKDRSEYNKSIEDNLIRFCEAIKKVTFVSEDFREIKLDKLTSEDFVYCDPPYLCTTASYNEQDGWNERDERDLLVLLDDLNESGIKFALSNVLYNKGRENEILKEWIDQREYNVHHLDMSYSNCNYHAKDKVTKPDEVLITNYIL